MKLPLLNLEKKKTGERELPSQFQEEYRPDLIKRAVHAVQSAARQPYGAFPEAGLRHSYYVSKRRRDYKGCYGFGISRVARKVLSRRGTRMFWVGAFSPQTTGGHRAHPPKAEKIFTQKLNKTENRKAIRSAMAATLKREVVAARGHKLPQEYPFIISADLEQLSKTTNVEQLLYTLGFNAELQRTAHHKVRPGIGKLRGRRYRQKRGLLIVVGGECPLLHAARNIPGVDIVSAPALNAHILAPGTAAGRVTLWTENAMTIIEKQKLFS